MLTNLFLQIVERLVGRRLLWKAARRAYLYARGGGSLDIGFNGEAELQRRLAQWSASVEVPLRVIDVGANYGQWSRSFLRQLRSAGAPAPSFTLFEPVPAIRTALEERLKEERENGAELTVEAFAVSDLPGSARFVVTDVSAGDHHLESTDYNVEGEYLDVEVISLDQFTNSRGLRPIHMVKIDAEGYDPKVMEGMSDILLRGEVDLVQFEYGALFIRCRSYLYDVFELAHRYGYDVATLSHRGVELHYEWHPDLERFYGMSMLLIHPRAHDRVPVRPVVYDTANVYG